MSTNLLERNIYENYLTQNSVENITEGLDKICRGNYAYMAYDHEIHSIKTNCSIIKIRHPVLTRLTAVQFDGKSGFSEAFFYR